MIHGRADYECIQDNTLAKELARILLRMRINFTSSEGLVAQLIAKMILNPEMDFEKEIELLQLDNYPRIPNEEPVFLLRAQDPLSEEILKTYLSKLKESDFKNKNELINSVNKQLGRFQEWPIRRIETTL
jgi:hypothetical protein